MKLLALDTSSLACTVGVLRDDQQFIRHEEQARAHTRLLLPMIRSVLDEAKLSVDSLDAVVLGNGPGSFIGMRIAASVAQGLAFAAGLKIVPVSSMAAVAAAAAADRQEIVVVTQDAHMSQVYLGIYQIDEEGIPAALVPERLHEQSAIEQLLGEQKVVSAGYGWQRYPELLAANRDLIARHSDVLYPSAAQLLAIGEVLCGRCGGIDPQALSPAYLRQKVAEKPVALAP